MLFERAVTAERCGGGPLSFAFVLRCVLMLFYLLCKPYAAVFNDHAVEGMAIC